MDPHDDSSPTAAPVKHELGAPICANCGYDLAGLVESSKCPECGRPLVEILTRTNAALETGKRYRSSATIMGMPAIDIAMGARGGERKGRARGFLAIGDDALGVVAIGGMARGLVAIGGMSIGGFTLGGMSLGLFAAVGGGAFGGVALGGAAGGGIAKGGGAFGYIADGGGAMGHIARGPGASGTHVINRNTVDQQAVDAFDSLAWLLGSGANSGAGALVALLHTATIIMGLTIILGLGLSLYALHRDRQGGPLAGSTGGTFGP